MLLLLLEQVSGSVKQLGPFLPLWCLEGLMPPQPLGSARHPSEVTAAATQSLLGREQKSSGPWPWSLLFPRLQASWGEGGKKGQWKEQVGARGRGNFGKGQWVCKIPLWEV